MPARLGLISDNLHLGAVSLGCPDDPDAILALAGLALGQPAPAALASTLAKAHADWRGGDRALANIRLALFPLPHARSDAALLVAFGRRALEDGMAPDALLRALDLDPRAYGLSKYSPDQPRVPRGQHGGGEFAGPGLSVSFADAPVNAAPAAAAAAATPDASVIARLVEVAPEVPELFAGITELSLEALAAFASSFPLSIAVLGALILTTTETGGVSEGRVPGGLGASFRSDLAAGRLTLSVPGADGSLTIVAVNNHGVYVDRYGRVLGIWKDGRFILDQRQVAAALAHQANAAERAVPAAVEKALHDDEPSLCPAPQEDRPHGSSRRARDYENFMHFVTNPQNPLKEGQAIFMRNPVTGAEAFFDDCRRSDGHLQEFKGYGYAWMVSAGGKPLENITEEFLDRAKRQVDAGRGRVIEWHFAEREMADYVGDLFRKNNLAVRVLHSPMN